jgi:hypothetical protein
MTLDRKKPASESMGRTEGDDVQMNIPRPTFKMRPEAGPMALNIPISKWQAAVRKPDHPPHQTQDGMM